MGLRPRASSSWIVVHSSESLYFIAKTLFYAQLEEIERREIEYRDKRVLSHNELFQAFIFLILELDNIEW